MEPLDPESPSNRRFSITERFVAGLGGVVDVIARTGGAASVLLTDSGVRRRGVHIVAKGIQQGIQTGASSIQKGFHTVQQGPKQIQSVLQRLSQQIEEQRMHALLQQQRDAPVDVQVGFQLYEDAPQELRSRLWMALLEHPELLSQYQGCARALQAIREEEQQHKHQENEESVAVASPSPQPDVATPPIEGAKASSGETPQQNHQQSDTAMSQPPVSHSHPSVPDPTSQDTHNFSTPTSSRQERDEGWEVVLDGGAHQRQGRRLLAGAASAKSPPWNITCETFRNDLMAAMTSIPWPLPTEHPPESRYATLLQISIGQEDVDEVIARDIHRTFPEYPLFGIQQGQMALFRVLKAYSLHDLEVGYCQGMAFVAGLVLFYVPEEPAFQIFCRLLSESGPDLRRLYLPGLEGLKAELRKFDFLLGLYLPNLKAHLENHGVVAVLFASQWFLTAFSCPFPVSFACRLIDIMLVENSDTILLKTAITIMAECEAELLMQEDFEELLTYLKVEPVQWPAHRLQRVLNAAMNSLIGEIDLAAATEAAKEGHALRPLSTLDQEQQHQTSGIDQVAAGVQGEGPQGEVVLADAIPGGESATGCRVPLPTSSAAAGTSPGPGSDDVEAELAKHRAELDDELLAMVLDLDHNWAGEGEEYLGGFEEALMASAPQQQQEDQGQKSDNGRPQSDSKGA